MSRLRLAELVDLEARLLEEQGEPEEVRRSRYRQLGRRLAEQAPIPQEPAGLLQALLRLDPRPSGPGRRFESALRLLQTLLAILGLLTGGAASLALFDNSGRHPVNVLTVLAALVATQLLLLLLLVAALLPRSEPRASGPVAHLLRSGLTGLLRKLGVAEQADAIQDRLDAHRGLLRWLLLRTAQVFGIAFNVGALACAFYRFAGTDISFGWSTTFQVDPAQVQRLTEALATPWAWLAGAATPSPELVRATQYSHLEGHYLAPSTGTAGAWWPFLVVAVVVYGLLPRVAAFTLASVRVRSILDATPARNPDLARLAEWMGAPLVSTRPEGPDPAPYTPSARGADTEAPLPPRGAVCELLNPDAAARLTERFGWTFAPGDGHPLVAVVSAWEEPTKGQVRRFQGRRGRDLIVLLHDSQGRSDPRRDRILERWKRDLPKALDGVRVRVEPL